MKNAFKLKPNEEVLAEGTAKTGVMYYSGDILLILGLSLHITIIYWSISWAVDQSITHLVITSIISAAWLFVNIWNFIKNRSVSKGRSYAVTSHRILILHGDSVFRSVSLTRKRAFQFDYETDGCGSITVGQSLGEELINASDSYIGYEKSKIMIVFYFFFPPYADFVLHNLTNYNEVRDSIKQQQSELVKKKKENQALSEMPEEKNQLKELLGID